MPTGVSWLPECSAIDDVVGIQHPRLTGALVVVVPTHPHAIQLALVVLLVAQGGEGLKDTREHAGGHVPEEGLEILHPGNGVGDEGAEHLSAFLMHSIFGNPFARPVAQGELAGVLGMVVYELGLVAWEAAAVAQSAGEGAPYAERGQAVGESVNALRLAGADL
jgi:hypothetical protein